MRYEIESWVTIRRLTAGRRAVAAHQMGQAATEAAFADIAALCAQVGPAEIAHIGVERQYAVGKATATQAVWSPELLSEDLVQDRLITETRDLLAALSTRRGTPRGDAARTLHDDFFPEGVTYYTRQPMVDQAARVGGFVNGMAARRAEVETATIGDLLDEVAASHTRYQDLVNMAEKAQRVAYDSVKASDLLNQRTFLEIIVASLAATQKLPPAERRRQREVLLAPAAEQDRIVGDLIRRKRRVTDVDPLTGAPVEDEVDA